MSGLKKFSIVFLMLLSAILLSFGMMSCDIVGDESDDGESDELTALYLSSGTLSLTINYTSTTLTKDRRVIAFLYSASTFNFSTDTPVAIGYTSSADDAVSYTTITMSSILTNPVYLIVVYDTDRNNYPDDGEPYSVYSAKTLSSGEAQSATPITIEAQQTTPLTVTFSNANALAADDIPTSSSFF